MLHDKYTVFIIRCIMVTTSANDTCVDGLTRMMLPLTVGCTRDIDCPGPASSDDQIILGAVLAARATTAVVQLVVVQHGLPGHCIAPG